MVFGTGKLRVLIVRHGETDCNVQGVIQGQLDTDLNHVGRRQAEYVGAALSRESIDEVYSSPLRRAKDTADAIVAAQSHNRRTPPYWLDDRLKERGFGSLEGKTFDRSKPKRDSMDGIEQMNNFVDRLASFFSDVVTRPAPFSTPDGQVDGPDWVDEGSRTRPAPMPREMAELDSGGSSTMQLNTAGCSRTVLLVSHGAAISALVGSYLLDTGLANAAAGIQRTRIWNCSITEVTVDTSHLPTTGARLNIKKLIQDGSQKRIVIERWADLRHLPVEIDDTVENTANADEMVGKETS